MNKTAKEYVYDAINHMRKNSILSVSPVEDTDDVFDTYGWDRKDVCKLCEYISLDASHPIIHSPVHAVRTVGEIVKAVDDIINNRGQQTPEEALYFDKQIEALGEHDYLMSKLLGLFTIEEALLEMMLSNIDIHTKEVINKYRYHLQEFLRSHFIIAGIIDQEHNQMKILDFKVEPFLKIVERIKGEYKLIINNAGGNTKG